MQDRIYNYFERNPQLRVLFVFDRMGVIEEDLKNVSWPEDYVYRVYDGKWFNLKVSIAREWRDKKVVLVFPAEMRPVTEETQLRFPLLDVYAANMEFKDERYEEFIQQYGLSLDMTSFVKNNIAELTSNKVSTILQGYLTAECFNKDLACRALVSSYLGEKRLLDWDAIIIRMIIYGAENETKRSEDFYKKMSYGSRDAIKAVNDKLTSIFGVTFDNNNIERMRPVAERLKYNAITQSISIIPADDYKALKISGRMAIDQINRIYEKGEQDPALSSRFKDAMEKLGDGIRETELIKVYGPDAPFFFMTENIGLPIIEHTIANDLMSAPQAAMEKMRSLSLRLGPESELMPLVRFVEKTAAFYDAISNITSLRLDTPGEYVKFYVDSFAGIDRYYRHIVGLYYQLPELPETIAEIVAQCKNMVDKKYAQLANTLNYEWLDCVAEKGGRFDKTGIPRQNDFYSIYNSTKRLVVIVSDALRYEVAVELYEKLANRKHIATIAPMLSLLPSETKYCKPALLPHETLKLKGDNLELDDKVLSTIRQRTEQLCRYKPDAVCVNFDDVKTQVSSHRELFKRPLVYVMHDRIDNTGHDQSAAELAESCRKTVEELDSFVNSLHMSANCYNIIITSDHGFIFNDTTFEDKDKISIKENGYDATTRYYLIHSSDNVDEIIKFDLSTASSIHTDAPIFIATPKGTNRFAIQGAGYKYAHGGATLQEMIVPIIMSNRRDENSKKSVDVILRNNNLNVVSSRLRFQLVQKEAVSMGVLAREVICALYDGDRLVSDEISVKLDSTDSVNVSKRTYDVTLKLRESGAGSLLQLRVWDSTNPLNPLIKETVKNNTIIEQDF